MTTVATISASSAADAAVFAGPARSTDSSGQFATELSKTTQQVRERQDGQQPAHSNRSVDRQVDRQVDRAVDNNAINSEPSADGGPRVSQRQETELAEANTNEDFDTDSTGITVTVPVVAEPVITEPVITDPANSDGIDLAEVDLGELDLGEINPTDIDLSVEVSPESEEGLAAAALGAVVPTLAGITPASRSTDASPTASIEVPANVTGQMNSGQLSPDQALLNTSLSETGNMPQTSGVETDGVETDGLETGTTATDTDEAINNLRGMSSANSLAADSTATDSTNAEAGVKNNVGTMPVSNTKNINFPTADGAVIDSSMDVTTNAPAIIDGAGVDGEGAEAPSGSNPALSSLSNSASTDTESESGSTTQSNSGSSAGSSNEQAMGMDRSARVEDAPTDRVPTDRVSGPETRVNLDASGSPIVTNPASTSASSSVTLGTGSALPTAEPKAPAPAPVSTQMSAHLSTFKGLANGTYETTLRLYPEELGQVSVRIQVNGGTVSIHAFGASDMAVQALREAMPDLRQDLLRSGLDLVDSQVDSQVDQESAFLGNEQESSSGRMVDSDNPDRPASQLNGDVSGADIETLTSIDPSRGGRVDVRV